jgi:REP element-mobilizing transposase RayT
VKPLREELVSGFLQSDYAKYKKALALQRLKEDPDGIFMDIRYHFAWNVTHRRPVFDQDDFVDFAHEVFSSCSEAVRGFAGALWIAPDHIHLYIVSDGELSVEAMVGDIKAFSRKSLLEKYPDLMEKNGGRPGVWDDAYFSETIG